MRPLSCRHKIVSTAGIETPSTGGKIGVSTTARNYWRKLYSSIPGMLGNNDYINTVIASDYAGATPVHRFILKSKEPAEIRKSNSFLYVAVIRRDGKHDVMVMQKSYKEAPKEVKNYRMTDDWIRKVYDGEIKTK